MQHTRRRLHSAIISRDVKPPLNRRPDFGLVLLSPGHHQGTPSAPGESAEISGAPPITSESGQPNYHLSPPTPIPCWGGVRSHPRPPPVSGPFRGYNRRSGSGMEDYMVRPSSPPNNPEFACSPAPVNRKKALFTIDTSSRALTTWSSSLQRLS